MPSIWQISRDNEEPPIGLRPRLPPTLGSHGCLTASRFPATPNAFSKKLENFKAAVALHYAYYNFVKSNIAVRCTPAMASGVTNTFWTVRDLVEMIET